MTPLRGTASLSSFLCSHPCCVCIEARGKECLHSRGVHNMSPVEHTVSQYPTRSRRWELREQLASDPPRWRHMEINAKFSFETHGKRGQKVGSQKHGSHCLVAWGPDNWMHQFSNSKGLKVLSAQTTSTDPQESVAFSYRPRCLLTDRLALQR